MLNLARASPRDLLTPVSHPLLPAPPTHSSICLDSLGDDAARELSCGHRYHRACIGLYLEALQAKVTPPTCPLCRHPIEVPAKDRELSCGDIVGTWAFLATVAWALAVVVVRVV